MMTCCLLCGWVQRTEITIFLRFLRCIEQRSSQFCFDKISLIRQFHPYAATVVITIFSVWKESLLLFYLTQDVSTHNALLGHVGSCVIFGVTFCRIIVSSRCRNHHNRSQRKRRQVTVNTKHFPCSTSALFFLQLCYVFFVSDYSSFPFYPKKEERRFTLSSTVVGITTLVPTYIIWFRQDNRQIQHNTQPNPIWRERQQ